MSHFYGIIQGRGNDKTSMSDKSSGLVTYAASFDGAIQVDLIYDKETGKDKVIIEQIPWRGRGSQKILYKGILGK